MGEILFRYERVNPASWAYLSSLLTLALFFKFNRFWSVRNFDLLLVILLAPGLLCIKYGLEQGHVGSAATAELFGYIWLFSVNGLLLLRMLLDSALVRRPLLDPNLTVGGLTFIVISLLFFLLANVLNGKPERADLDSALRAEQMGTGGSAELEQDTLETHGPGFTLLYWLPHISTQTVLGERARESSDDEASQGFSRAQVVTTRVMAVISQMMIVLGVVLIGVRHFDSYRMGIAAATLYLLLPYTALWTGAVTHSLPGALLVWAVFLYRRPVLSGALIGALSGSIYYPIFLMPLWVAFYWNRGLPRFLIGFGIAMGLLVLSLVFASFDASGFNSEMMFDRLQLMFNIQADRMDEGYGPDGVWRFWNDIYRLPVVVAFVCLSVSFLVWPAQKNLGTLLSCSAALMIGTQFWHAHSGGMALAWCLPVLLLTVFRPNLEDRVAVDVVAANPWRSRRSAG